MPNDEIIFWRRVQKVAVSVDEGGGDLAPESGVKKFHETFTYMYAFC